MCECGGINIDRSLDMSVDIIDVCLAFYIDYRLFYDNNELTWTQKRKQCVHFLFCDTNDPGFV